MIEAETRAEHIEPALKAAGWGVALTREERASGAKIIIITRFNSKQKVFLDFVLSHYVSVGVQELEQDKLTPLLRLKYHDSIADAYTEGASMQENVAPPRSGRDLLVQHEKRVLARARSVKSTCVRPVLVNGDRVVVRWIFEFEWLDGTRTRMEELAYQRWDGERIAEEQFFYDPAQRQPIKP